jgi:L-cystine uptake protein TcyP (sodium:dicarboxylate symporter family)
MPSTAESTEMAGVRIPSPITIQVPEGPKEKLQDARSQSMIAIVVFGRGVVDNKESDGSRFVS